MDSYSLKNGKNKGSSGYCRLTLLILAIFGAVLLVGGSVVYVNFFPKALREKVAEALTLSPGTEAEERFLKAPVPIYFKVFVFNVTNKDDVNQNGVKPKLQEVGPYVFRLEKTREIRGWNPEQGTLQYKEFKGFHFIPEMTKGSLSDRINHVNVVSIGMGVMMQSQAAIFKALGMSVDEMITNIRGELIETHTVDQMLFNGFIIKDYFPEDSEHLCRLKNNCLFSFWQNNTGSQLIEINTGAKGIDEVTRVVKYNNETSLNLWYGDTCNAINGSIGPQFKPGITRDETFYGFSPEICRSLEFVFWEASELEGIPTLRFQARDDAFSYKNGANKCFCPNDNCDYLEGFLFLGPCHEGSPIAVSWPHFYLGKPERIQDFEGIKPDGKKHKTFVDIEPITGTTIGGYKRLQVNFIVKPDPRIRLLNHIKKELFFPVLWIEESGSINEVLADEFRTKVLLPYRLGKWSLLSAIAVGAFLLVVTLITWTMKRR